MAETFRKKTIGLVQEGRGKNVSANVVKGGEFLDYKGGGRRSLPERGC